MATVSTDILVHIFQIPISTAIGEDSVYTSVPHPGTGKLINGWKFDERTWPTIEEQEALAFAPSIWDPTISGVTNSLLQSGYGDNKDLILISVKDVLISGEERWSPEVNHGYFYSLQDEWYLYSDSYQTENFLLTNTVSGKQYVDLSYDFKPTIPIQVRQFKFNPLIGRWNISKDIRKKVEFSDPITEPEFIVDTSLSPPRLWLNGIYNEPVGTPLTGPSGILETIGISDGTADQFFSLNFSPVDTSQPVEVWLWEGTPTTGEQWTVISGTQEFSPGDISEARVDYDLGIIQFGNYNLVSGLGAGRIPPEGWFVGVHYTKGFAAFYEPINTSNFIVADSEDADVNPLSSTTSAGFVQIGIETVEPASIELTSTLPQINPFLISLGNNVGELIATVKSSAGTLLEGQQVTFEILDPKIGTFGATANTISAVTAANGEARTLYNSPLTTNEVGQPTIDVVHQGSDTIVTVEGLTDTGDLQRIFLFKVHKSDEVLGIPEEDLDTYYSDYFTEEEIIENPDSSTVPSELKEYEEQYRTIHNLNKPETYETGDILTGKKTIILTIKTTSGVIDPETGDEDFGFDVMSPLYPSEIAQIGTSSSPILQLKYNNVSLELPGVNDTKSYFVVSDAQTNVRAFVTNKRTNKKIFSNTIQLRVTIPDTASGVYLAETLGEIPTNILNGLLVRTRDLSTVSNPDIAATQSIPSFDNAYQLEKLSSETYIDWFRRTRKGDSAGLLFAQASQEYLDAGGTPGALGPETLPILAAGEIPLGFRIKSSGITVAAALDQITFLDPNSDLVSNYYD